MKSKLSITVDQPLVEEIEKRIAEGSFRNKSHVLEYALKCFLRGEGK